MIRFELTTDRVDYLQLAFPAAGPGLIARWGNQATPYTVRDLGRSRHPTPVVAD